VKTKKKIKRKRHHQSDQAPQNLSPDEALALNHTPGAVIFMKKLARLILAGYELVQAAQRLKRNYPDRRADRRGEGGSTRSRALSGWGAAVWVSPRPVWQVATGSRAAGGDQLIKSQHAKKRSLREISKHLHNVEGIELSHMGVAEVLRRAAAKASGTKGTR
jgi:hypothetical protein